MDGALIKMQEKRVTNKCNHDNKVDNSPHHVDSVQIMAHYFAMANQNSRKMSYKKNYKTINPKCVTPTTMEHQCI